MKAERSEQEPQGHRAEIPHAAAQVLLRRNPPEDVPDDAKHINEAVASSFPNRGTRLLRFERDRG